MSGVLRTQRERASRQPASRLRRTAARVASSVPGFLRLLPARAASRLAPLALLLAALAFAQPATAQTTVDLIANDGQTSADADAGTYGTFYATSFTTGSHSTGYELTRVAVWLKKDGSESRTGSGVRVNIYTEAAGTPGVAIGFGRISTEPTTSWAGYGLDIRPGPLLTLPVGIDLAADTTYWVEVTSTSNQGTEDDHYFVGGTSSDNEDSGGLAGWSLGNDRLLRASDGTWDATNTNANALRLELRGSTRAAANLPSAPTGLTVSAGSGPGSLDVIWTAPSGTILDYDLRYYEGSTDPTDAADWVEEHETDGLDTTDSQTAAATITGLKSGTAYRVQVRAASVDGEGAWSASVDGTATSAFPPRAPTGLTVSAGTNSGELDASWTAPSGPITDYDLRYYEGSADPTDAADWVEEHETNGLGTADSTSTSATIKGLKSSTAYRVQVRAGNAYGEGAWSASVAGTTRAASGTNRAPRVLTPSGNTGEGANACKLWTDTSQPANTISANAGTSTTQVLKTRGTETEDWPATCAVGSGNTSVPVFDDLDGGDLYYTLSYTLPDNVRGLGGNAPFFLLGDGISARAVAIGSDTNVRIDLTARDDQGASASAWVRFTVKLMPNAVGAPSFSATVADQTAVTGTAFSLVLPAATGGDVTTPFVGAAINSPYTYAVSGLPAGLSFDAATRRVSGTPSAAGTFTVAYTADDADALYSLKASADASDTADAASQTFTIEVGALPSAPTGLTVSAGTNSGELDASWTAASGTVTDYDLRYYAGSADPTDAADWVEEHETDGLGTGDSTSTSVTIKGLKSSTAYRVQVRAANAYGEGAWSASVAGTTGSPPGTNNAPRVITEVADVQQGENACKLWTDKSKPASSKPTPAGTGVRIWLKTRNNEQTDWPATCSRGNTQVAPVFDDQDGGDLYYTWSYTLPDNVRGIGGNKLVTISTKGTTGQDTLAAQAVAIGSATSVRVDLTARDAHGASATAWVRFDVAVMPNAVGAPSFSATVTDQTVVTGTAFSLALPAATGGDVSTPFLGEAINSPYTYAVSGLPAGLSFDAATRTVSGTPSAAGTFTVTYTADDADALYSLKDSPSAADTADAASQTFWIQVRGDAAPAAPTGVTVSAPLPGSGGTSSLNVSWTAPSGTVTDYDLRYYEGAADPTDEADWVEEGEAGSPPDPGTATSATIAGLKAGRAWRVQVRAANAGGEGPWSASAWNNTYPDTTAPVLQSARVNGAGTHLTLYYDEKLDAAFAPKHNAFALFVAGTRRAIPYNNLPGGALPVTVDGSTVTMGLGPPALTVGKELAVTYDAAGAASPIRNPAGLLADSLVKQPVINTVGDSTAPALSLAEVSGSRLTLYYNENLDAAFIPARTAFSVSVDGATRTPTHVAVSDGSVTLTLVPAVRLREQAVTVTYTVPGTKPIQDLAGNRAAALTGHAATNKTHEHGLKVSAGTGSGSLNARWSAPSGVTVTDYDLRYYEGSTEPTDAADWVEEHETDGLGTADSTATSATIKGLKAGTVYRVQVRAATADGEGPWSSSVSATTRAASGTNHAPKAMTSKTGDTTNACKLWTDTSQPAATINASAGATVSQALKVRGTETKVWPDSCTRTANPIPPVFDDQDAGDLYYTLSYTLPANVRGFGGGVPFYFSGNRLWAKAVAIGSDTNVRVDLTARDEHGASATSWVRFAVKRMANTVGAPAFSATVADQTADGGTAFSLVLPAATGGDVSAFSTAINSPYMYAVSGLPAGLSFDAATRTVSGTPTAAGSFPVTYTADDGDEDYSLRASPDADDLADAATQTFTIEVGAAPAAPPPPAAPTDVTAAPTGTSLAVSWTAPSGTITDYDLRYYAGSEDPADDADWVEDGEALGLPDPGTSTSATIARLITDTVYRVQVRAASANGEGAWSDSASARIDTTAPVLRSARVSSDGTRVTLYYDEELDSAGAPAHRRFSVTVNNAERTLPGGGNDAALNKAVTVSGSTVTMNLGAPAVTADQKVAVSYDVADDANPLKNLKGIKAPGISGLAAINDVGTTKPGARSLSSTVALTSTPTHDTDSDNTNDTYGLGAKITVQLTFSEKVTVDTSRGRPWLKLQLHAAHSGAKRAVYETGSGTATLTFSYTVQSDDSSSNGTTDAGIAVLENSLALTGGTILSASSGLPANLAHPGLDHDSDHKVNGKLDAQPPRFQSATVDGNTLKVTFDEDLDTGWLPLAGRFFVTATPPGGSARSLQGGSVSISSSNPALVTVVLTEGVGSGEAVKVVYVPHHTDGPRDANGNPVTTFVDKPVTNLTAALGQPTGVWASASALGGSLDVTWKAPGDGTAPTGYELRYYQGTGDPPAGREADWKEDVTGLPDPGAAATSATIEGLKANTAYRVQVRAKTAVDHGPWSISASAITGSPKAGNRAPRVLNQQTADPNGNVCSVVGVGGPVNVEIGIDARANAIVARSRLVGRNVGETAAWPSVCTTAPKWAPIFDDVDGDKLTLSVERHPVPDHVLVDPDNNFGVQQPRDIIGTFHGRVFFQGLAHFRKAAPRAVRAKLTATDPHGAWVSVRLFFLVAAMNNEEGAPSLPKVEHLDASMVRAFSHVLPAATGGDQSDRFDVKYYYAVSGLPEGLAFDPETRRISGTPSESGAFTVTYIADDPDRVGSAYLNPEATNTNDVARRTFTLNVRPFIDQVRVTSAPTHDANGDGRNDTYGAGDKIAFDVELTEPVAFDPGTGTGRNTARMRLRVGQDSDTSGGTLKTADLAGVFHGGKTLRFEYTVQAGDNDPDGVFIDSFRGAKKDQVLNLMGTATLKGLVSKLAPNLKKTDFITGNAVSTDGIPMSYVNGRLSAGGPMPSAGKATVNGETLRVVFNKELAALSAADLQALTFLFGVQGTDGTGGNRNAFQHPGSVIMWSGDTDNRTLELTLGTAARAGETITLSYKLNDYKGPIEDTSGNMAPAFVDLVVKNDTGTVAVAGAEGTLVGNTGQSNDGTHDFSRQTAQAFTTGSNAGGYKVTSVKVSYSGGVPAAASHTIYISRANPADGTPVPGRTVGVLTYGSVSGTSVTYDAPDGGIELDPGATYAVVHSPLSNPSGITTRLTNSDNEDSGAANGWSLADTSHTLPPGFSWQSRDAAWQIAIDGAAVVAPTVTTGAEGTLVGNTGQSHDHSYAFNVRTAQAFTTGSNAGGYKLTSVKVPYSLGVPAAATHSVIISRESVTGVPLLSDQVELTYGSVSGLTVTYDAPDGGIDLEAGTTYFVVHYPSSNPTTPATQTTDSNNEDAGKADGWTLADTSLSETGGTWTTRNDSWQIAIDGAAVTTAPQPQSASVAGTKLKIVFDKALDDTSTESGQHFTVVMSDRDGDQISIAGTQANVAISEKTVTVTLAEAVPPDATAQVTYEPPTPSLKAADSNGYVADFLGFKIETVYDIAVPELKQAAVVQTSKNPDGFRVALYYDEALDPDSVPATTDFGLKLNSNAAVTPNAVAVEDNTVVLTVDLAKAPGDERDVTYTQADVSYTKGTNPIRDPAGNEAAAFTGLEQAGLKKVDVEAAGTPAVVAGTVTVAGTLVSNTGQSVDQNQGFSYDRAQAFTTGSNTLGSTLTSVAVPYTAATAPAASTHGIYIHASNGGVLSTRLATLSYGSVSGTTVTYTAPGEGIELAAGTTYFVVLDAASVPTGVGIKITTSDNEDSGAADGWTIADTGLRKSTGATSWSTSNDSWQIAIHGTATSAATETVRSDEGTLVGNTGQSADSQSLFSFDYSQAFTTGSTSGYTLTSVTVPYNTAAPPASSHTISIHASNSSNRPGTSLGTLAYGTVSGQTVTYTASGNGIDLDGGTTYFVVLDASVSPSSAIKLTSSGAEDTGASDGWSLADTSLFKPSGGGSWSVETGHSWQIAIQGTTQTEKTVPALTVDGASLTVTYDKSLDPASLPDPGRFRLLEPELEDDGNGNLVEVEYGRVTAVAVSGKQLVLTLNGAASPCDTFTLSYSRSETEKNIRTFAGHEAPDMEAETVANAQAYRCDTAQVVVQNGEGASGNSGGTPGKQGKSLTVKFDRPLDTGKALKATAFGLAGAAGGAAPAVEGAAYTGSGAGVALTLARALESGETVTLSYTRPRGDPGLWNAEGNQIADFSGVAVPVPNSGAPAVTGVEVVSDSGSDGTYGLGETIRVRVTFSEAVEVDTADGKPRLRIDMDPAAHWGMKWAAWESGSGTAELVFAYEVVEPNESTQGIAVLADTLETNGGTIRPVSGGADAGLGHDGLDHDPAHKVDWRLTPAPAGTVSVTGVEVVSDPGNDDTYALGETIRVRVTFSEAVEVDTAGGAPRIDIDMDPAHWGTKRAAYESGSGTASLTFAHEVVQPNESTRGIAVLANTLALNGGAIRAVSGGADAHLAHAGLGHDPAHKVNWRLAPASAGTVSVTGVAVVSDAGEDDTYGLGDVIRMRVTFSEAVEVDTAGGAPRLDIDMDPAHWGTKRAAYESGSGTAELTFAYEVVQPNESTQGIAVLANTLEANGGAIRPASGSAAVQLSHAGLGHDPAHKVDWRPTLSVADAEANEGTDAAVEFEVTLGHAANHRVTVDYATADGSATAGEDYTATSGTLTFAAGETVKTVSVPILDDVIDEGEETFTLTLSNAQGARIVDGEATGTIANDDPLQKMWLSRFGRTVADHVTAAVSDRLANPLTGAQVTVGGQTVDLAEVGDAAWLGQTLTSIARAMGAPSGPAPANDDGWPGSAGSGSGTGGWPGTGLGIGQSPSASSAPAREITGRELLLGSAFHLVRNSENGGPGLAAWGRVTTGGFDGEETTDSGTMRIDGSVTTGILGADAQWNRLLGGVAISVSEGEGSFAQPGVDSGKIESTMTTVSPYARFMVTDRVSVWGLAGWGTGDMTIVQDARAATDTQAERAKMVTRTDLEMRLGAVGGRGALLTQDADGGMDLALKADAFFVETEAQAISNEGNTTANASRMRLVLEGGHAFAMGDGATLRPSLELGLRHDGGDAETGTGVELGGGVAYTDPVTGLSVEAKARMLVAHADSNYEEWGVSGAVRLAPGERQRGLSFSLSPALGATSSAAERLWGARDAGGLAPGGEFAAARGLQGELGYGMSVFGDRFTGTPNVGFGLSDSARDYRIGWRLTSAIKGDPGFEVNLDATRKEAANSNEPPEHGLMLRAAIKW